MAVDVRKCRPEECKHLARKAYAAHPVLVDEQELKERARAFQALGNETRLKILGLVSVRELCVCDIVAALEGSASTVAHHLRMLEKAGLITARHEGKFTLYVLKEELVMRYHVFESPRAVVGG